MKSVAASGKKIGFAHGQANNFLITKRREGGSLSLKDTQYALNLATRLMAKDSKLTHTPAKTYLTAAADPALHIDKKTEQKEHMAMLLSFYETRTRTMVVAAAKAAEEMVVVDAFADTVVDEAGTAVAMVLLLASRPLPPQLLVAMML